MGDDEFERWRERRNQIRLAERWNNLRESASSSLDSEVASLGGRGDESITPTPTVEVPLYRDAAYAYQRRELAQPIRPSGILPISSIYSRSDSSVGEPIGELQPRERSVISWRTEDPIVSEEDSSPSPPPPPKSRPPPPPVSEKPNFVYTAPTYRPVATAEARPPPRDFPVVARPPPVLRTGSTEEEDAVQRPQLTSLRHSAGAEYAASFQAALNRFLSSEEEAPLPPAPVRPSVQAQAQPPAQIQPPAPAFPPPPRILVTHQSFDERQEAELQPPDVHEAENHQVEEHHSEGIYGHTNGGLNGIYSNGNGQDGYRPPRLTERILQPSQEENFVERSGSETDYSQSIPSQLAPVAYLRADSRESGIESPWRAAYPDMEYMRCVTITGDVSSLAERPHLARAWVREVAEEILEQKPNFAVIHLQGLGAIAQPIEETDTDEPPEPFSLGSLFRRLSAHPGLKAHFTALLCLEDERRSGLASVYLAQDVLPVQLHIAKTDDFEPMSEGWEMRSAEGVAEAGVFPGAGLKGAQPCGYVAVRWRLFGKVLAFVNVALHQSNEVRLGGLKEACEEAAVVRRDQMAQVFAEMGEEKESEAKVWAGAFNSSLDQAALVQDLVWHHHAAIQERRNQAGDLLGHDYVGVGAGGKPILSLGPGKFDLLGTHDWFFGFSHGQMCRKYNRELGNKAPFDGALHEAPIYFPPNAPMAYDQKDEKDVYRRDACPSWSHRVLCNDRAWEMIKYDSFSSSGLYYGLVGRGVDVGAAKPVAMHATLCVKRRPGALG